ncbi:MAG: chromosome partitioning protein ParB [Puniceicoccaceae bacterium]|nr:MAG: chromosome partitioning protein ParB [Puniceicoccaceae bacterium]
MRTEPLELDKIDIYGGTQTRVATNDEAIAAYAEEMEVGTEFPPIIVYYDGSKHWLADGFHRYLAARRNEKESIACDIRPGGRSDALLHALGANSTNGVYRSSADKRNAVEIALEEWPDHSNNVVAEICKVSADLVRRCRKEMIKLDRLDQPKTVRGKDGKEYPAAIEREPRGETEKSSSEAGGGAGGMSKKGKGEDMAFGGANHELEADARAMIRKGEMSPNELDQLKTATAFDYVETAINVLERMNPEDPKRNDALLRLSRWLDKQFVPAES